MPFGLFEGRYPVNRKIRPLSDAAFRLDVSGVCWSADNLTDGHIPEADLRAVSDVRQPTKAVRELVARGRWHEPGHECVRCPPIADGWVIHDYHDFNPRGGEIKAAQEAKHEARSRAGRMGGKASGESRRTKQTAKQNPAFASADASGLLRSDEANAKHPRSTHTPTDGSYVSKNPPGSDAPARTRGGLQDLISQVRAVRPFWSPHSIADAAVRCTNAGRTPTATLAALLTIADDPATIGPGRVLSDGPWWRDPTARTSTSTADLRVAETLALADAYDAADRRGNLRAIEGGGVA
jgi:hypothetical protein